MSAEFQISMCVKFSGLLSPDYVCVKWGRTLPRGKKLALQGLKMLTVEKVIICPTNHKISTAIGMAE